MIIDIDKRGLEDLIRGHIPSYPQMELDSISKLGSYIGGHNDHWEWDFWALQKLTELELLNVYNLLSKSKP